jgi:ubiquinol-cytochrome c reductase cytochrome c1 subunit
VFGLTLSHRPMMIAAVAATALFAPLSGHAAGDAKPVIQEKWAFDGIFGKVDRPAAQRGLQVYKEVCAACHGLKRVSFRTLQDLGFSEAEVKALADSYSFKSINDIGEEVERPGLPSDHFPSPYPNENAARAANNGALPPDLSLRVKSAGKGANSIYSILVGYLEKPPEGFHVNEGMYYNPYFTGGQLAMPQPLSNGQVTYEDGTEATVQQMSHDVVTFLQWAAEPEMEERKRLGLKVMIFLAIATVFFAIAKRRVWKKVVDGEI